MKQFGNSRYFRSSELRMQVKTHNATKEVFHANIDTRKLNLIPYGNHPRVFCLMSKLSTLLQAAHVDYSRIHTLDKIMAHYQIDASKFDLYQNEFTAKIKKANEENDKTSYYSFLKAQGKGCVNYSFVHALYSDPSRKRLKGVKEKNVEPFLLLLRRRETKHVLRLTLFEIKKVFLELETFSIGEKELSEIGLREILAKDPIRILKYRNFRREVEYAIESTSVPRKDLLEYLYLALDLFIEAQRTLKPGEKSPVFPDGDLFRIFCLNMLMGMNDEKIMEVIIGVKKLFKKNLTLGELAYSLSLILPEPLLIFEKARELYNQRISANIDFV